MQWSEKVCTTCLQTGQHRCYALGEIMQLLGPKFDARISPSFTIGFFENMPKQVSFFISKVGTVN
jgi:hypothetical protein